MNLQVPRGHAGHRMGVLGEGEDSPALEPPWPDHPGHWARASVGTRLCFAWATRLLTERERESICALSALEYGTLWGHSTPSGLILNLGS